MIWEVPSNRRDRATAYNLWFDFPFKKRSERLVKKENSNMGENMTKIWKSNFLVPLHPVLKGVGGW